MVFLFFFGFLDGLAMLSPTVFGFYGFWGFSDGSVRSNLVIYIVYIYIYIYIHIYRPNRKHTLHICTLA